MEHTDYQLDLIDELQDVEVDGFRLNQNLYGPPVNNQPFVARNDEDVEEAESLNSEDEPLPPGMRYGTIQCSINKLCTADAVQRINEVLIRLNKMRYIACIFSNFVLAFCVENGRAFPRLDKTFFKHCLAAVRTCRKVEQF